MDGLPRSRVRELDDLGSSFDSMAGALTAGREALELHNQNLEDRVQERTRELETARLEILTRLALAGEFRDDDTHLHTERVARTAQLARWRPRLTAADTDLAPALAAPLHDIGKIGIPDAVLLKPGKLTSDEFELMKTHAQLGADMLAGSTSPVLQMAAQIALHHHERWDGTGYPQRLQGEETPRSLLASSPSPTCWTPLHTRAHTSRPGPSSTPSTRSETKKHGSSIPASSMP